MSRRKLSLVKPSPESDVGTYLCNVSLVDTQRTDASGKPLVIIDDLTKEQAEKLFAYFNPLLTSLRGRVQELEQQLKEKENA